LSSGYYRKQQRGEAIPIATHPVVNFRFSYLSISKTYRKVHGIIANKHRKERGFCSIFWRFKLKNTREWTGELTRFIVPYLRPSDPD
jgi:hypothetical protein